MAAISQILHTGELPPGHDWSIGEQFWETSRKKIVNDCESNMCQMNEI